MTDQERHRLAAILGMLGSAHAGERAAAGLQAEAFRKRHGLTWAELLPLSPAAPIPDQPAPPKPPPAPRWAQTTDWGDLKRTIGLLFGAIGVGLINALMR